VAATAAATVVIAATVVVIATDMAVVVAATVEGEFPPCFVIMGLLLPSRVCRATSIRRALRAAMQRSSIMTCRGVLGVLG
jgi:hypothetical protein